MNGFFRSILGLALLMALHVGAGSLVGALFPPGVWVDGLAKPGFYPPGWVFPVVWTLLYAVMGLSVWIVLRTDAQGKSVALRLYAAQLAVNLAYTPLCFGMESTFTGLLVVAALLALLAATIIHFRRVSVLAALLLVPYLLWVCFALALSVSLWRLNP